jgi:hypothetical protein
MQKPKRKILTIGAHIVTATLILSLAVFLLSWSSLSYSMSLESLYGPTTRLITEVVMGLKRYVASTASILSALPNPLKNNPLSDLAAAIRNRFDRPAATTTPKQKSEASTSTDPAAGRGATSTSLETVTATTTPPVIKHQPTKIATSTATTTPPKKAEPKPTVATTTEAITEHVFRRDVSAPDTSISSKPAAYTGSTSASFVLAADDSEAVFHYELDGASWISTVKNFTLTGLAEGTHTIRARATDQAGNTDATPAEYSWQIDLTGPTVSFDTFPANYINRTFANFVFSSNEASTIYNCQLDGGSWQTCAAAPTFASLSEDAHTLLVYGVDPAGNRGGTSTHPWQVDLTAPTASINDLLPSYAQTDFTVTYSGVDGGATSSSGIEDFDLQYNLDNTDWLDWKTGVVEMSTVFDQAASPGQFVYIRVRARDGAGNLSDWSVSTDTEITGAVADHVMISEVQISGGSDTDEFIELYNPTAGAITLSNYALKRKTADGTEELLLSDFQSIQIDAYGYLLITHADYDGAAIADLQYDSVSVVDADNTVLLYDGASLIDKLGFGAATDNETLSNANNPAPNQSLERKANSSSTAFSMAAGGADHIAGNSYDNNNNSTDFVLKNVAEPQNVDSGPESP